MKNHIETSATEDVQIMSSFVLSNLDKKLPGMVITDSMHHARVDDSQTRERGVNWIYLAISVTHEQQLCRRQLCWLRWLGMV